MAADDNFDLKEAGSANCCLTKVEYNKFFIIWSIENFSYCRQSRGDALSSCIFSAEEPGSLKFRVDLYPRGTTDYPDDVMVSIRLITDKDDVKAFVSYNICLGKDNQMFYKQQGECVMVPGRYCHMMKMVSRDQLIRQKETIFPDDKVGLLCALTTSAKETTGITKFEIKSKL